MAAPKYLREVTDKFSLFDTVRKYTDQNDRRYLTSAIRDVISSPKIQEHMKLRELLGFFGHEKRRLYAEQNGKNLHVPENAVLMIDGKPMDVVNIPTNVCVDISISDEGIVTHTEQILDNDLGRVVSGLYDAKVGGWSWATKGSDKTISALTDFAGFDYVYIENFISLDKSDLMFESSGNAQERLLEKLKSFDINHPNAISIVDYLIKSQQEHLIFESAMIVPTQSMELIKLNRQLSDSDKQMLELKQQIQKYQLAEAENKLIFERAKSRDQKLKDIISALPVFIDSAMLDKIINPESDDDVTASKLFFESVGNRDLSSLPLDKRQPLPSSVKINTGLDDSIPAPMISSGKSSTGFE